ncbi:TonB family protein [Gracilimonas mengyeensis]|uniref:TonB family C-terminal domain-containing protein n=1 Tax=Gracilimonas mengyeensis TaxID=1302730 RepID=A0A521BWX6_9BACT|nr:TonB family protein [Gracilimonas mengyeensis]SMO51693.1 TonB family C-terminal domain-containing protein [Gracilimonas mengyeensis]
MGRYKFTEDDRFALWIATGINIALLLFSLFYTMSLDTNVRPSYIEVEFGEFASGQLAEYSEVKNEEVAQRPNPSETEPEDPVEEVVEPEESPQTPTEEVTKPVDLPDQQEEIVEEPVTTPETEKIDPEQQEAEPEEEEVEVPPVARENEDITEGEESSGDEDGARGELNSDQGMGNDQEKSSPYELKWEGEIDRSPMVQPLPQNSANTEAVITVRFEVRPDGTVGRIIPLRKMNPELEREVMSTLRSWRFSRLPGGVPQQTQWGTITFRFVFD